MALAKKTVRPGALRPYEQMPSVYALDVALCAATALAYAVALPIGLIAGVPQRCFSRIRKAPRDEEEWLVVMGCGYAYPAMIDARLNAALHALEGRPDMAVLLTGSEREGYSEPGYMRRYLEERGIAADRMLLDGQGHSTLESLSRVRGLGISPAVVVSSDFHILRCVNDACLLGIDAIGVAAPFSRNARRWRYWLRDLSALFYDQARIALGRGVRGAPADGTEACEVLDRASFRGTKTVRDRV